MDKSYIEFKTNNGGIVLIDAEDFDKVNRHAWHIAPNGYAQTILWDYEKKRLYNLSMHSYLIGKKEGMCIDHINRNKTDNRKSNLRHVTPKQNQLNTLRADRMYYEGRLNGRTEEYIKYGLPQFAYSPA